MTLHRCWLSVASVAGIALVLMAAPQPAGAGGVNFGEDSDTNDGPSYFGFVRDSRRLPRRGRQSNGGAAGRRVARHPLQQHGRLQDSGLCQGNRSQDRRHLLHQGRLCASQRVARGGQADAKDPVEVDCTLQKQ